MSKTSKSYTLGTNRNLFFLEDFLIGYNTRDALAICNDCEKTQTGSRFKFIWTGGEYGELDNLQSEPFSAAVGNILLHYRDPGENISLLLTELVLNIFCQLDKCIG